MTTEHTTHNGLNRRDFIRRASAAAVAGLGAPYIWGQKTDDTLVVNSFGGEYQELFEKNVIEPFEKKFGVKVMSNRIAVMNAGRIEQIGGPPKSMTVRRRASSPSSSAG